MKKLLFLLAFCLPLGLIAQTSIAPVVGVNFIHHGFKYPGKDLGSITQLGIKAGALIDIPLSKHLCLQPGVYYFVDVHSNLKVKNPLFEGNFFDVKIPEIEIPVILMYKRAVGAHNKLLLGAGPYIGAFLTGMSQGTINVPNPWGSTTTFKGALRPFKRNVDYGINISAGYELGNGMFARLNSQFGLRNLNNSHYEELDPRRPRDLPGKSSVYGSDFGVSIGYLIGKKAKVRNPRDRGQIAPNSSN